MEAHMKSKLLILVLFFCSVSFALTPNERALHIAGHTQNVTKVWKDLVTQVRRIRPDGISITEQLKNDTLELLTSPSFSFRLEERRTEEPVILEQLRRAFGEEKGFVFPETVANKPSIFPLQRPMPFLAAAGGPWNSHHVYPGGLVYHSAHVAEANRFLVERYNKLYKLRLNPDLALLAGIWHDAGKVWALQWKDDGTLTVNEGKIAETSLHHIFAIAELLARRHSVEMVLAVAGAHDPLMPGNPGYQKVVGYLRAAAILSGAALSEAGLEENGGKLDLAKPVPLFPLVNHMGDSDWMVTIPAMRKARELVYPMLDAFPKYQKSISERNWKANAIFAKAGALHIYQTYLDKGGAGVKKLLGNVR